MRLVPGQPQSVSIRTSQAHTDPSKVAMPENVAPRTGPAVGAAGSRGKSAYQDRDKLAQIRFSNISAAKAVADAIRTSLGPKGMDKMVKGSYITYLVLLCLLQALYRGLRCAV